MKTIVTNRRAHHDYEILDELDAGIMLKGTEIKSICDKKMVIEAAYVEVRNGEVWLINSSIEPYEFGNINNHEPGRNRKLLLRKQEIKQFAEKSSQKGLTIIPLLVFLDEKGRAKVKIAVAQGKKHYDKRQSLKERDVERDMRRNRDY